MPNFDPSPLSIVPKRTTHLPFIQRRGNQGISLQSPNGYPKLETLGHFYKSLQNGERVSVEQLRRFASTIPAKRAIGRIANGVLAMPWSVSPPRDDRENEAAIARAAELERALRRPNYEEHNSYRKLVRASVNEILVLGFAAIERQQGDTPDRPFWLWPADGSKIRVNTDWRPHNSHLTPRFFDCGYSTCEDDWTEIYNEHLFIIQPDINTYELVPPSTLEVAYRMISTWLRLGDFQERTASQATREYFLSLVGAGEEELKQFREYWELEVQGQGKVPFLSQEVQVTKLGAKNDEELYLKYTDYLLRSIALAFDLSNRDFNITEHDNRATSGAAADSTFSDAVLPMALAIQESLQMDVIDFYAEGFTLDYTDTEPRNQWDEASVAALLFKDNIITKDESRTRVGMPPIRGKAGNAFANGTSPDDDPTIIESPLGDRNEAIQETLGNNNQRETSISNKPPKLEPAQAPKTLTSLTEPTQIQLSLF